MRVTWAGWCGCGKSASHQTIAATVQWYKSFHLLRFSFEGLLALAYRLLCQLMCQSFLCPAKDTTIYDRASVMKKTGVLLLAEDVF